jgi:hypothetical protein
MASTWPLLSVLACLPNPNLVLLTRYLWAAGRWTVICQEAQYMPSRKYLSACQGLGGTDDLLVIL